MLKNEILNIVKDDLQNDNFKKALEKLDKLLIDNPDDENIFILKTLVLKNLDKHNPDEILKIYDEILGINPLDTETLLNKGAYYLDLIENAKDNKYDKNKQRQNIDKATLIHCKKNFKNIYNQLLNISFHFLIFS